MEEGDSGERRQRRVIKKKYPRKGLAEHTQVSVGNPEIQERGFFAGSWLLR